MKISKSWLVLQFLIAVPVMMIILFWPAGTLNWAEAWTYIVLQLGYAIILTSYFLRHNPEMIRKRMAMKLPPRLWDKIVMSFVVVAMTSLLIIPGLDVRHGWSSIPAWLEAIGFIGFLISSYWIFLVMKENSYLLKTVEIQKNQKTVTTGPYKYVRHPMYASSIVMVFSIALALGSLYALIPAALSSLSLIVRTALEDKTLQKELKGYKAYTKKTRYRILPFVW
ncbi:isoprenylcysteine carboxylmethyltransferase family protein [Candidatus Woesearchaeota archaeon]|nr:isoprenylcysteine carboxylmethyltransferase family protein [Candidatus Woesearchaeota archaeon]